MQLMENLKKLVDFKNKETKKMWLVVLCVWAFTLPVTYGFVQENLIGNIQGVVSAFPDFARLGTSSWSPDLLGGLVHVLIGVAVAKALAPQVL
jgi:hypothetical protein